MNEQLKLIQLMESEYKTISEFSEAVIQAIKKPLEQHIPLHIPGTDKRWGPRQPFSINVLTFKNYIECQLFWWYGFGEPKSVRLYVGVLPESQSWSFVSSVYVHGEFLKSQKTSKDAEGDLLKYIQSRNLEGQLKFLRLLESPWDGLVSSIPVTEAIQSRDRVLDVLQRGVEAVLLLATVGKKSAGA